MSERRLGPSSLLFQSFRHSQGSINPQLYIFRYMDLHFGVKPDLHPTGSDFQAFQRYLSGADKRGAKVHVNSESERQREAAFSGWVYKAVKDVRYWTNVHPYGKKIARMDEEKTIKRLTRSVLNREMQILERNRPWTNNMNNDAGTRPERIKSRVSAGMASFVLYHGRDGHSTGFEEFDQMYTDVWNTATDEKFDYLLDSLNETVADKEFEILGSFVLAQEAS